MSAKSLKNFRKHLTEEKGATMVEYALLAALIGVAGIGAVTNVGEQSKTIFNEVGDKIEAATAVIERDNNLPPGG